MDKYEIQSNGADMEEIPSIQSLDKFLTAAGRSRTTGWRWRQLGYLKTVQVCGRPYVTRDAIVEFLKRAAAGELSGGAEKQKISVISTHDDLGTDATKEAM
jgi:hypothetical protein